MHVIVRKTWTTTNMIELPDDTPESHVWYDAVQKSDQLDLATGLDFQPQQTDVIIPREDR